MNRFLIASLLCGVAFGANAQSVGVSAGVAAGDARMQDEKTSLSDRNCLRHTGTRIIASVEAKREAAKDGKAPRKCASAPGRSYDRDDLDRTGETNLADALRKLDPSIN